MRRVPNNAGNTYILLRHVVGDVLIVRFCVHEVPVPFAKPGIGLLVLANLVLQSEVSIDRKRDAEAIPGLPSVMAVAQRESLTFRTRLCPANP